MGEPAQQLDPPALTPAAWRRAALQAGVSARALVAVDRIADLPWFPENCFKLQWLADEIGTSKRQARRITGELSEAGLLERYEYIDRRYGQRSSDYRSVLPTPGNDVRPQNSYVFCHGVPEGRSGMSAPLRSALNDESPESSSAPDPRALQAEDHQEHERNSQTPCSPRECPVNEPQCRSEPHSETGARSRLKVPARESHAVPHAEAAHREEGAPCDQPSGCAKAGGGTAFGEGPALVDPLIREALSSRESAGKGSCHPRTHATCAMQAAASPSEPLPQETGLSDAHGCEVHAPSPAQPPASPVRLPLGAPVAGPSAAPEGPQKPQKHRGESLPDPDLQSRLEALPRGEDAAPVIVRGLPPEKHEFAVVLLEHRKPRHAGRYVHTLLGDWARCEVEARALLEEAARTRAAADKRAELEAQAEAERARASAQAARERQAGSQGAFVADLIAQLRVGGLNTRVRKDSS